MANPRLAHRRPRRLLAGLLLVLWLVLPGLALAAGSFLSFSDLHFNPFADQSLVKDLVSASAWEWEPILSRTGDAPSGYGQEANYALFASTLADMRLVEPNPDFLIFTGDILAHNFNSMYQQYTGDSSQAGLESFIAKTVTFFALQVEQSFPGVNVYVSLGNNDAYEGDYMISPGGSFLEDSSRIFAQYFLTDPDQRSQFLSQYPSGGYYSLKPAGGGDYRIISLNSVYFSSKRTAGAGQDPGLAELDWLEGELAQAEAAGERVLLLSHIPPGVDVFGTEHDSANGGGGLDKVDSLWNASYTARFQELMMRFSESVIAILSGHTHMDDFRLVNNPVSSDTLAYIHITPAVSPQFGNNPGFQVFANDPASGSLRDFTTHYLDVGASQLLWRGEYSFSQAYGQPELSPDTGRFIFEAMADDQKLRDAYTTYYKVSNRVSPFKESDFTAYWCGIAYLDPWSYANCFNCAVTSAAGAR